MKISIESKYLNQALAAAGKAIESRPILPVLSHVLLCADTAKATLDISGTDLERFIVVHEQGVGVEESGSLTVPWKLLKELVATFRADKLVHLESGDDDRLTVKCGKAEATLRGLPAKEFPNAPSVLSDSELVSSFEPNDLAERLSQVAFAAATDESRSILTGVFVESKAGDLAFVTADGFRLAVRKDPIEGAFKMLSGDGVSTGDGSFVMPGAIARDLIGLLADETDDVSLFMSPDNRAAYWRLADIDVVTQLLQGNYVNYRQIIPSNHTTRVIVNRAKLTAPLKSADLFVRDTHILRFEISGDPNSPTGKLRIVAENSETGNFDGDMSVSLDGEPVSIAFNSQFVQQALDACGTDEVVLELSGNTRPGVIRPNEKESRYLNVIMPMHLREA